MMYSQIKSPLLRRLTAATALGLVAVSLAASSAGADGSRHYRAVDFGFDGEARGINDRGDVVGEGLLRPGAFHPYIWRNGRITDLGVLEPGELEYGRATDINNHGQVVGFSVVNQNPDQSNQHAFIWQNGTMVDLDPLALDSTAVAINNRGQVVGTRYAPGESRAFVWQNGAMTDLGTGTAADINDRGQIIGQNQFGGSGATMWFRGQPHDLGAPPGFDDWRPVAINEWGWVVGNAGNGDDGRAFLWKYGTFVELGRPDAWAMAIDINNHGQILGLGQTAAGVSRAFLWQNGRTVDLSGRGIPDNLSMNALGDRGQILGMVLESESFHAVLYR